MVGDTNFGIAKRKLVELIIQKNFGYQAPELQQYTYAQLLFIIQEMMHEEGKPYLEADDGVRRGGFTIFKAFVKHCLYRNIANYDTMILLSGTKGAGKSSAGIMLAKYWCRLLGLQFSPERHIAYNNADVSRKIDMLEKFEPILCLGGNTNIQIKTIFGVEKIVKIKELIYINYFEVLTYNEEKKIFEYSFADGGCIKQPQLAELYRITLENKSTIEATAEHKFLTKSGEYKKLIDLTINDSIRCGGVKKYGKCSSIISIIKLKGKTSVYDIIGTKNHNFVANNIVVHNCDEAVRFVSSEDWAKKENKELKKKLAQVRTKHLFFILCFPLKIYKVEKTYLESYVNYWVDLYGRGKSMVFVRDENPVSDSWRLKDFVKIGNFNEFTTESKIRDTLKKHPNFWTTMGIPKPSRELYEKYLKVREKNVYDDDNVLAATSREDIAKSLLVLSLRDIMVRDTTLNMNRIMLHIKNEYDVPISKELVQSVIEDSKQLIIKVREKALSLTEL